MISISEVFVCCTCTELDVKDLLAAVEKINSGLKGKAKGSSFFHQDEISSLGLGK